MPIVSTPGVPRCRNEIELDSNLSVYQIGESDLSLDFIIAPPFIPRSASENPTGISAALTPITPTLAAKTSVAKTKYDLRLCCIGSLTSLLLLRRRSCLREHGKHAAFTTQVEPQAIAFSDSSANDRKRLGVRRGAFQIVCVCHNVPLAFPEEV